MPSPKKRALEALAGPTVEYHVRFTQSQREWLEMTMGQQLREESRDGHLAYFAGQQRTLRPKLEAVGPVKLTLDEVNYLLFTMGGVAATATLMADRLLHWQITEELIKVRGARR